MDVKDIKNKALSELIHSTRYNSSTIENDANDAVTNASSDAEIIRNLRSSLESLQGECEDIMIKLKEIQDPITAERI